jgi:hypothetical protein
MSRRSAQSGKQYVHFGPTALRNFTKSATTDSVPVPRG